MESISSFIQRVSDYAPFIYGLTLVVTIASHIVVLRMQKRQLKEALLVEESKKILEEIAPYEERRSTSWDGVLHQVERLQERLAKVNEANLTDEQLSKLNETREQFFRLLQTAKQLEVENASAAAKTTRIAEATAKLKKRVQRREAALAKIDLLVSARVLDLLQTVADYLGNPTLSTGHDTEKVKSESRSGK